MSRRYSIISPDEPYFAAVQEDLSFMDAASNAPGISGFVRLDLEFALHAQPVQLASADEVHEIFSYHIYGPAGPNIVSIGVTPSGKLVVRGQSGVEVATQAGFLVADGRWYFARADYAASGGASTITLYFGEDTSVPQVGIGTTAGGAGVTGPTGAQLGRITLFNGRDAKSHVHCAIRRAVLEDVEHRWVWEMGEGDGAFLDDTYVDYTGSQPTQPPQQLKLRMQKWNPIFYPLAWGPVPFGLATGRYRWDLNTDYTPRPTPVTAYTLRAS